MKNGVFWIIMCSVVILLVSCSKSPSENTSTTASTYTTATSTFNPTTSTSTPLIRYNLRVSAVPEWGGTVSDANGAYDSGARVTLMAEPSPGYRFSLWWGDVAESRKYFPNITITMDQTRRIFAVFELISDSTSTSTPIPIPTTTPTPTQIPVLTPALMPMMIAVPGVIAIQDIEHGTTAEVSSEGSIITIMTNDGKILTFTIPASALSEQETIALTPISDITGLPIEGTLIGGVNMLPEGIQFSETCSLEVQIPPAGNPMCILGLTFSSNDDLLHLNPVVVQDSTAIMSIDHFSSAVFTTTQEVFFDLMLDCETGIGKQTIDWDQYIENHLINEYFGSHWERERIRQGQNYIEIEYMETNGDPNGSHNEFWFYQCPISGNEYSRLRQYNSNGILIYSSDQINGNEVSPSQTATVFTPDFATSDPPPTKEQFIDAIEQLQEKSCAGNPVYKITISPSWWAPKPGMSKQLVAEVRDAYGNLLEGRELTWSSDNENVARVDANGLVTSVGLGDAFITATAKTGGQKGYAVIYVFRLDCSSLEGTWTGYSSGSVYDSTDVIYRSTDIHINVSKNDNLAIAYTFTISGSIVSTHRYTDAFGTFTYDFTESFTGTGRCSLLSDNGWYIYCLGIFFRDPVYQGTWTYSNNAGSWSTEFYCTIFLIDENTFKFRPNVFSVDIIAHRN